MRKIILNEIKGYEGKRRQRKLHRTAKKNQGARMKRKLLGKNYETYNRGAWLQLIAK